MKNAALSLFLCMPICIGFSTPVNTFDTVVNAVTERFGGIALEVQNVELSGTFKSLDAVLTPFTLTAKRDALRLEVRKTSGTVTTIRHDTRTQVKTGSKTDFPNQVPHSISALNLAPIYALLRFKNDARFTRSLVVARDGTLGLNFLEGTPPGFKPPPFPQPKLTVTFWVDSSYQITSASYSFDRGVSTLVTYTYFYDSTVVGHFLQPAKIESRLDGKLIATAEISATRKDVATTSDFFKILESYERQ